MEISNPNGSSATPLQVSIPVTTRLVTTRWLVIIPAMLTVTIPVLFLVQPAAAVSMLAFILGWTVLVGPCGCAHTSALGSELATQKPTRWWSFWGSYLVGGILAGIVTGLAVWGISAIVGIQTWPEISWIVVAIGFVCVTREFGAPLPLPEIRRQTRWKWVSNPASPINPFLWSVDVGFVFATWLTFSGAWFLAAMALGEPSPWIAASIFASYWVGRALPHLAEQWSLGIGQSSVDLSCAIQRDFTKYRLIHAAALLLFLVPFTMSGI